MYALRFRHTRLLYYKNDAGRAAKTNREDELRKSSMLEELSGRNRCVTGQERAVKLRESMDTKDEDATH